MTVSTTSTASTGSFTLTVTGTGGGLTRSASVALVINPRQPTSLSFNVSQGYAGNDCYVITVGNGAGMMIDLQYTLNGVAQPVWSTTLDANGQLHLTHPARLPPGPVRVTIRVAAAVGPRRGMADVIEEIDTDRPRALPLRTARRSPSGSVRLSRRRFPSARRLSPPVRGAIA